MSPAVYKHAPERYGTPGKIMIPFVRKCDHFMDLQTLMKVQERLDINVQMLQDWLLFFDVHSFDSRNSFCGHIRITL